MYLSGLGNHPIIDLSLAKNIGDYHFAFADLLGQGSFSKVYRGHNHITGQVVAIKVVQLQLLKTATLQRLISSEIEVLKRLDHPNILKCYEVLCSERNCYIITELCNGGTLQAKLKSEGCFDEKKGAPFVLDILRGLLYLSQMNIVHRDIKSANIFLKDGVAKIADFGFARYAKCNFTDANIGSPLYMSPEGYINNSYGPKTDVWGFGVLIYELLHGNPLFYACQSKSELFYLMTVQISKNELKSGLSQQIKDAIVRCLQIDQMKRPTMFQLSLLPYFQGLLGRNLVGDRSFDKESFCDVKGKENFLYFNHVDYAESKKKRKELNLSKQSTQSGRQFFIPYALPQNARVDESMNGTMFKINKNKDEAINSVSMHSKENEQIRFEQKNVAENKILKGRLTFHQCVWMLHYGRLIFKFLKLLEGEGDRSVMMTLTKWLLQLFDEMLRMIAARCITYEKDTILEQQKLREVCIDYQKKYAFELMSYTVGRSSFQQSYSLDFMKYFSYGVFQQLNSRITKESNVDMLMLGHLIVIISEATKMLCRCFILNDYKEVQFYGQAEAFLKWEKEKITIDSYLVIRKKMNHF